MKNTDKNNHENQIGTPQTDRSKDRNKDTTNMKPISDDEKLRPEVLNMACEMMNKHKKVIEKLKDR